VESEGHAAAGEGLAEVVIKISDGDELGGSQPLVIVGPNGSGKTRFGTSLAQSNNADHIGALRNIQLNAQIGRRSLIQATKEFTDNLSRKRQLLTMIG